MEGDAKIAISIFECQGNNNSRETGLHLEKQRFVANHTGYGLGWIFPEHILDMKSTGLWIGMSVMEFMTNNTILIELLVFLHDRGFPKIVFFDGKNKLVYPLVIKHDNGKPSIYKS